ncbi:hypothetical protein EDD22DRAFT_957388 [Suillus occidentalis]|nr:hypothetical protein EDD22DRAFT_957388 [Suillus occidentalis]
MPVDANEPDANEQNTNRFQAILRSLDGATNINSDILDPYLSSAHFFLPQLRPYLLTSNMTKIKAKKLKQSGNTASTSTRSLVPPFRIGVSSVKNFESEAESLNEFLRAMENTTNSAHCDDTGSLKHNGLQYLLKDPAKDRFDPPILKTHGKAVRGWNHTATARLLCPARDILEFDEDPHAYMDRVKSGQKKITSKQWPSMFYNMSLYNPRNKKLGFLRSHTIVQGWRHIFTGPMSALSKEHTHCSSKPAKGKKHHLTEPGPRNIMYAAIQIYFVACNAESWTPEVGTMNLDDLYYTAVDLLETHADEQWVKDLMQFWKDESPGLMQGHPSKHRRVAVNSTASDSEDDMDDFFGNDSEETQGGSGRDGLTMDREPGAPTGSTNNLMSTTQHEPNTGNTTGPSSTAAAESDSTRGTAAAGSSSMDGATEQGRQAGSTDVHSNGDDEDDDDNGQPWRRHRLNQQDTQRECSPLTPPPTSPVVPPTTTRGCSRGPSNCHGRGKCGGKR